MSKKKTHTQFICELMKIQPDLKVVGKYVNYATKVRIKTKYGYCLSTPDSLLSGCKPTILSAENKTKYFKKQLKSVQPSITVLGEYINSNTRILVKDKDGEYLSTPANLLSGNKPTLSSSADKTAYFKMKLYNISPDVVVIGEYVSSNAKILVKDCFGICKMSPSSLLQKHKPSVSSAINKTDYIRSQFKAIHGNKYDYSKVDYKGAETKVIIICEKHGEFLQVIGDHIKGHGCFSCTKERGCWSRTDYIKMANGRESTMYKIKCWNETEEFYKIGITCKSVSERFPTKLSMPYKYKIISETKGEAGLIYDLEKSEHRKHKHLKYAPKISFGGETECFTELLD